MRGMKKFFVSLLFGFLTLVGGASVVFADTRGSSDGTTTSKKLPLDGSYYDNILTENILSGSISATQKNGTEGVFRSLFYQKGKGFSPFMNRVNAALGTIALLWFIVLGGKFIFAHGNDEKITACKEQFGWTLAGLVTIGVAEMMAFNILDPDPMTEEAEGFLKETTSATNFAIQVHVFKVFVQYIIGGIALIKMMMSGYDLIIGSEEEENIQKEKGFLRNFFYGGGMILLAEALARIVSVTAKPEGTDTTGLNVDLATVGGTNIKDLAEATYASAETGISEFTGLINFFLSFIGVSAALMLVLASIYYVLSFGSEDQMNRAKRTVIVSVVGIIVVVSSFTLMRFMIR